MFQTTFSSLITVIKSNSWSLFLIITSLLSPIKYLMFLVGCMIILDTIFGIWSSKKLGLKLQSRKFARFITKMLIYQVVLITAFALDNLILGEFFLLFISIKMLMVKAAALALISAEIFSIDEKLKNVNDGQGIWFHFSRLLKVAKFLKKESEDISK